MNSIPSDKIRNIAIVGQTGSGKSSVVEAIHHCIQKTGRMGRIEDGNTVSDFEPEEIKHRHSASLSVVSLEHRGYKLNLLDTPGSLDFAGEVQAGLYACDLALFVISANEPLNHDSLRIWQAIKRFKKPSMFFINKLDKEHSDFSATLDHLRELFGPGISPIEMPLGQADSFKGLIDLFDETAYIYRDEAPIPTKIPPEVADAEHRAHDVLVEEIVIADEDLTLDYLGGKIPDKSTLETLMGAGVRDLVVSPVLAGSAINSIGIDHLIRFLLEIAPPPASTKGQVVRARTYKTYSDPFLGRVSLMKVLSGTLNGDIEMYNTRTHATERLHSIFSLKGKDHSNQSWANCGDIIGVAKLNSVRTGDVLSSNKGDLGEEDLIFPPPMLTYQAIPVSKIEEEKLSVALSKLGDEEPTLHISRDGRTHNLLLGGLGELQLATALEKLARRYQVRATLAECEVEYLETFANPISVEGKYKKQSGGHGQFGAARIRFVPAQLGSGFSFFDEIVGGAIPRQFIGAVEKGVIEASEHGGTQGYPIVDFEAHLYDGAFHSVDSSEMSFKLAGGVALREAVATAQTIVLEPIMELAVTVASHQQGDVLGDLSSRRAKVTKTEFDASSDTVTITAIVPGNETQAYANQLRSLTAGQGTFKTTFHHYDWLPKTLYNRLGKSLGT